jgi:glycine C-acetyltransferase
MLRRAMGSAKQIATTPAQTPDPMSLSVADFAAPQGPDLLARTESFSRWRRARQEAGVLPYFRRVETELGTTARVVGEDGVAAEGINFGSTDYLGLSSHPSVREAAARAVQELGTQSGGSALLQGGTRVGRELEGELGELLQTEHVTLFPTGWGAGFGTVVALVRPYDHVVMDHLAHACLQQGVFTVTQQVRRHPHLDVEAAREQLAEIRATDAKGGILVISEGIFSMDADTPRLADLQRACREFDATLLVDVAHDLGELGPGGTGQLGLQGVLGKIDLVMGSFSKTFATNGGFLATHSSAVKDAVRVFSGSFTFSTAPSPLQSAIALEAVRVARSAEGDRLRAELLDVVQVLRQAFADRGLECFGVPCAIVAVPIGSDTVGRLASSLLFQRGVMTNLIEFPAVARDASRFRLQVMPSHTAEQAREAARIVSECIAEAREDKTAEQMGAA